MPRQGPPLPRYAVLCGCDAVRRDALHALCDKPILHSSMVDSPPARAGEPIQWAVGLSRRRGRKDRPAGILPRRAPFIQPRPLRAVPTPLPTTDYAAVFDAFFGGRLRMTSVYKPLLLRALLDAAGAVSNPDVPGAEWVAQRPDGRVSVKLDFVASRLAKYCWDMHYSFRLRQSHAGLNADIIRVIAKHCGAGAMESGRPAEVQKPPSLAALAGDDMERLRGDVTRRCIRKQVLWRLPGDLPGLYETDGKEGAGAASTIILGVGAAEYMRAHRAQIRDALNHSLATYLERINVMTPQIASKVDHDAHALGAARRQPLAPAARREMIGWQRRRCFYCEYLLGPDAGRPDHVDHVVPFKFVYSTYAYNCVVACQECNCAKSDRLPERAMFDTVLERNDDEVKKRVLLARAVPGYTRRSYDRLFDACISEYNGGRDPFTPKGGGGGRTE